MKITFNDWQKGMVRHPIYGKGRLEMVEVFENPGILKIKGRRLKSYIALAVPVSSSGGYVAEGPYVTVGNNSGRVYNQDGSILRNFNSIIEDILIYKDYLMVRNSTRVSFYGPLSGGAQWFDNVINGLTNAYRGQMIIGQDDYLYITNGNYIAKAVITAQPAGTAPTVTTTLSALDLPDGHNANCIAELGTKLMIGTNTGRIYGWNRQAGTLGNPGIADEPIILNETTIWAMVQNQNRLFVLAGTQGNVYETNSSSYVFRGTVPHSKDNIYGAIEAFPRSMCVSNNNTLLMGIISNAVNSKGGVYEMDLKQSTYPIAIAYTPTGGSSTNGSRWGAGFVTNTMYGYMNAENNDFGVDSTDGIPQTGTSDNYTSICETELVRTGTFYKKASFKKIEVQLAEPLSNNQKIRLSYRKNIYEDYTVIGEVTFASLGAVSSWDMECGIIDAEQLQLKIELDGKQMAGRNIYLLEVNLYE